MADREEEISEWISNEDLRKKKQRERRRKIIPSSTDSITHTPVGDPLDAMEKVAFYFGDHPELPIVEVGLINESIIGLTFGEDVDLEPPFQLESEEAKDNWNITHDDALSLRTGRTYGWQTAALTAIGNAPDGGKMLLNTNRWQVLGLGGLDQFISAVMVGQVMEHATEPWAAEHHIWLVGYRELGPKLVNFLTTYHDQSYFHLVETVEQITADDITGTTATFYVKNSNAATLEAFTRIHAANPNRVGMLTDSIVTEQAMFISENDNGSAAICNAAPYSMPFFPNVIDENNKLYMAMEIHWEKHQEEAEQARQAVESVTMADFLSAAPEETPAPAAPQRTGATSISVEDLEALWNTEAETTAAHPDPHPVPTQIPAEPEAETEPTTARTEAEPEVAPMPAPADTEPAATPTEAEPEVAPAPGETVAAYAPLALLGQPTLHGADGSLVTGKPAEAVAYLHVNGLTRDGVEVSQALWPESENEGHTARNRRSRTTKAIKEALPGTFRVEEGQWIIDPLTTDLHQILAALAAPGNPEDTVRACEAIDSPLQGCAAWADEPRAQIAQQLRAALDEAMDSALDRDQLEIVKAVRQAIKKL